MQADLNMLEAAIIKWSDEKGILAFSNVSAQTHKLGSEFGELCDNVIKGKCVKDDLGDMFVVMCNIANLAGTTMGECAGIAYDEIKDRTGRMVEGGAFVKD